MANLNAVGQDSWRQESRSQDSRNPHSVRQDSVHQDSVRAEDIASILTYARREWEHTASPVSPAEVAKVRASYTDRAKAWSAEELNPATPPKPPVPN